MGVKQSLLVEERGGPLSVRTAGANVNDPLPLAATLDAIVVECPQPTEQEPQHLRLDKGYDNELGQAVLTECSYRMSRKAPGFIHSYSWGYKALYLSEDTMFLPLF